MHQYRSHTCAELREANIGDTVKLSGWVHSLRDHGGIIFLDLRDHYGLTQVVVHPSRDFYKNVDKLRNESVVCFVGEVIRRSDSTINEKLDTGHIEVVANEMTLLANTEILPFQVNEETTSAPEWQRLKYRFLDLRRQELHQNIVLRSKVIASLRRRLTGHGFNEFQTPILTSSSPEGARDFLVPSRIHPGQFYALPQAPQQFKQLLMVAGFDRYFQIAPCFRDEDARADRSPGEFYQLDLEMSFVTQEDVFQIIEDVVGGVFEEFVAGPIQAAGWPRIAYHDAMLQFGCDKPDLRNPLRLLDVSEVFRECGFNAFKQVVSKGGVVRAIVVKNSVDKPRKFFDDMVSFAQTVGSKGLGYIGFRDEEVRSPIAKFLSEQDIATIKEHGKIESGDVIFFIADQESKACQIGASVLAELAKRLELIDESRFEFCWVVDYPMFEKDEDTGKIEFSHNPFSMPQGEAAALETQDPLSIKAFQYDLVCNGIELSSGAIRNHRPDIMYKAFALAGYDKDTVDSEFGGMINALQYGAPPHGGIAPGVDRMVMLIANQPNIREIIAFPLNQQAQDLMMGAPSYVSSEQLKELCLEHNLPEEEVKPEL